VVTQQPGPRVGTSPGQELHVLDLAADADPRGATPRLARSEENVGGDAQSFDPVIDAAARDSYRRRLAELDEEIDAAELQGDGERATRAAAERDALVTELTRAYGLGGTIRRTPDHIERARKTVTRRIRDTITRIERVHAPLGRHLYASVHTGVFCSYLPERRVLWTIE
jgi:hypothetical protein